MTTLQGKTALVTGASRGIGRATAFALANSGARVLVHYGRSAHRTTFSTAHTYHQVVKDCLISSARCRKRCAMRTSSSLQKVITS